MSVRRVVLAAALACGGPVASAAAQAPPVGGADSAWVNLVTITRLHDEFAARPDEARLHGHPTQPWGRLDWPVALPEPFRSRAFVGESYVLLDVDSAGRAAGCRPLRAGAHPELDAFACTLLMRPGSFTAALVPQRESLAGLWVMGLRWESLTAASYRARPREGGIAAAPALSTPPPATAGPPPVDRWARLSQQVWIDTTSVSRVREDRFRFILRRNHSWALRRVSDGMTFDRTEEVMEVDCARGRSRLLERQSLLGERVVEVEEIHASIQGFWNLPSPRLRDEYCPVLREAHPRSSPVSLSSASARPEDIAGLWIGADSASASIRVHLELDRAPGGGWTGKVAYRNPRTGRSICSTPLRDGSGAGPAFEFTEVRCGNGVLRLVAADGQMHLERSATVERPGGLSRILLRLSPTRPAAPIRIGETGGRLENGDPVAFTGALYDDYTFTAPSAMRLRITMRSTELGPYLWVGLGDPSQAVGRGTDYSSGGSEAQVSVDVAAGATVRIRATAWEEGMRGAYTLQLAAN